MDSFRRSLDEGDICMMADAAVTMEEEFLLDIISDLDPTASVYCKTTSNKPEQRKSSRQIAQRRRPESVRAEVEQIHSQLALAPRGGGEFASGSLSPGASMSSEMDVGSSCSTASADFGGQWTTVPVVTPEQMFAFGRMVKEQRSCSSTTSSFSTADAPAGG